MEVFQEGMEITALLLIFIMFICPGIAQNKGNERKTTSTEFLQGGILNG